MSSKPRIEHARMRSLFRRFVVSLLALMLVGGIGAQLRLMAAAPSHAHCDTFGPAPNHNKDQRDKILCCSCYLMCQSSTMLAPNTIVPVTYGATIRMMPGQPTFRHGRVLSPELKPPKPSRWPT